MAGPFADWDETKKQVQRQERESLKRWEKEMKDHRKKGKK